MNQPADAGPGLNIDASDQQSTNNRRTMKVTWIGWE